MSLKSAMSILALAVAPLGVGGCGDGDGDSSPDRGAGNQTTAASGAEDKPTNRSEKAAGEPQRVRKGTEVVLADSQFGRMLFNSKRQAIYIFERDERDKSNCYGECAEAWPPVFTEGGPRAGDGVDSSLLGTTRRRDGRRQVTYAGKPLYYYVNEGPGEVKCHNVNLNGGFWWAVGADGERLQ